MQSFNMLDAKIGFEKSFDESLSVVDTWIANADSVTNITTRQKSTNKRILAAMHLCNKHIAGFRFNPDVAKEVLIDNDNIHLSSHRFAEKASIEFGVDMLEFSRNMTWVQKITQSPYYRHIKEANADRFIEFLNENERYAGVGRGADFYINITLRGGLPASRAQTLSDHFLGKQTGFYNPEKKKMVATISSMYRQALLEELPEHSNVTSFGIEFEPVAAAAFKAYYETHHDVELEDVKAEYYKDIVEAGGEYRCGVDGLFKVKGDKPVFILPDYKMPHALSNGPEKASKFKGLTGSDYIKQVKIYTHAFKQVLKDRGIENAEIKTHIFQFGMDYMNELTDVVMEDGVKGEKIIKQACKMAIEGIYQDAAHVHYIDNVISTPDMTLEMDNLLKPAAKNYIKLLEIGRPALDPKFKRINVKDDAAKEASLRAGVIEELIDNIEIDNNRVEELINKQVGGAKYKADYGQTQIRKTKMSASDIIEHIKSLNPDFKASSVEKVTTQKVIKVNADLVEALANRCGIAPEKLYNQKSYVNKDDQAPVNAARNNLAHSIYTQVDEFVNNCVKVDYEPVQSVTPAP